MYVPVQSKAYKNIALSLPETTIRYLFNCTFTTDITLIHLPLQRWIKALWNSSVISSTISFLDDEIFFNFMLYFLHTSKAANSINASSKRLLSNIHRSSSNSLKLTSPLPFLLITKTFYYKNVHTIVMSQLISYFLNNL